jgi:hypothetical protein
MVGGPDRDTFCLGIWRRIWQDRHPEDNPWELYNLNEDYSQAHSVAAQNPEKLKELIALFDSEARRNNVYPLTPSGSPLPTPYDGATTFVYHAGVERIPAASAPRLTGRAHRITADVEIPESGAEGVILAQGGVLGGYTLYIKDNRVVYEVNASGNRAGSISSARLSPGKAHIVVEFVPGKVTPRPGLIAGRSPSPGVAKLSVNDQPAGETQIAAFGVYYFETLDVGSDLGSPVSPGYASPFRFTGKIETVRVDLQ